MIMAGMETESTTVNVDEAIDASESVEAQEGERSGKLVQLPLTRIKHIMKMDPDVNLASQESVVLIAKATELFLHDMAKESYSYTMNSKRKTVQRKDMDQAIDDIEELAFLEGTLDS